MPPPGRREDGAAARRPPSRPGESSSSSGNTINKAPPPAAAPCTSSVPCGYQFKHVTDALAREMNKEGAFPASLQAEINRSYAASCAADNVPEASEGRRTFHRIVMELGAQVAAGVLSVDRAGNFLKTVRFKVTTDFPHELTRFQSAVIDALGSVYTQAHPDRHKNVVDFLKDLMGERGILDQSLAEALLPEDAVFDLKGMNVTARTHFDKRLKMANTTKLYKQQRFNMYHEESEGYSKVAAVLLSVDESNLSTTKEHLRSLIGCFDLDPNRVADLILENLEADIDNSALITVLRDGGFKHEYIAQLVGNKFQRYHETPEDASTVAAGESTDAREKEKDANTKATAKVPHPLPPASLINTSALLMANGLVEISALEPHLKPDIAEIAKEQAAYRAALYSETNKASAMEAAVKGVVTAPVEAPPEAEIWQLLASLLRQHRWSAALKFWHYISRAGVHPIESPIVAAGLRELVSYLIEPLNTALSPFRRIHLFGDAKVAKHSDSQADAVSMDVDEAASAVSVSPVAPLQPVTDLSALPGAVAPLLEKLGPYLADDIMLFTRLCRLFKEYHKKHGSELPSDEKAFMNTAFGKALGTSLLPAVSLIPNNPGAVAELWDVVHRIPYRQRYELYNKWRSFFQIKTPFSRLVVAECRSLNTAKYFFRIITVDNIKDVVRPIARLMMSSPLMVFNYLVVRIEGLDGGILNTWVECLKHVDSLAFDVGSFVLLQHVADGRPKLQPRLANEAPHFKALATFIGLLYKRYPQVEFLGLLEYMIDSLRDCCSDGLHLLHELLNKMGGMPGSYEDGFTVNIIKGRGGGDTLKMETALFGLREKVSSKAIKRLREVVLSKSIGQPLLILLAAQRSYLILEKKHDGGSDDDIEMMTLPEMRKACAMFDKCSMVFLQLSEFAGSGKLTEKYAAMVPSLEDMTVGPFKLDHPVAFHMIRPLLRAALKQREDPATPVMEGITPQALAEWDPFAKNMREHVRSLLPSEVWTKITPQLYLSFWALNLYDVDVPESLYVDEIKRLESGIKNTNRGIETEYQPALDGLEKSKREQDKERERKKREIRESEASIKALKEELAVQKMHYARVSALLKQHKADMFFELPTRDEGEKKEDALAPYLKAMVQHMVLPRATLSPEEAMYTARYFLLLHQLDLPNFPSLEFFHVIVHATIPLVFSATDQEASNIGIFLNALMAPLMNWASNRNAFLTEALPKEGFQAYFRTISPDKDEHTKYSKIFIRFERRLYEVLLNALGYTTADGYKAGRTVVVVALRIMQQLVDVFPYSKHVGDLVSKAVKQMITTNEELYGASDPAVIIARSYINLLQPRLKSLKTTLTASEVKKEEDKVARRLALAPMVAPARADSPRIHDTQSAPVKKEEEPVAMDVVVSSKDDQRHDGDRQPVVQEEKPPVVTRDKKEERERRFREEAEREKERKAKVDKDRKAQEEKGKDKEREDKDRGASEQPKKSSSELGSKRGRDLAVKKDDGGSTKREDGGSGGRAADSSVSNSQESLPQKASGSPKVDQGRDRADADKGRDRAEPGRSKERERDHQRGDNEYDGGDRDRDRSSREGSKDSKSDRVSSKPAPRERDAPTREPPPSREPSAGGKAPQVQVGQKRERDDRDGRTKPAREEKRREVAQPADTEKGHGAATGGGGGVAPVSVAPGGGAKGDKDKSDRRDRDRDRDGKPGVDKRADDRSGKASAAALNAPSHADLPFSNSSSSLSGRKSPTSQGPPAPIDAGAKRKRSPAHEPTPRDLTPPRDREQKRGRLDGAAAPASVGVLGVTGVAGSVGRPPVVPTESKGFGTLGVGGGTDDSSHGARGPVGGGGKYGPASGPGTSPPLRRDHSGGGGGGGGGRNRDGGLSATAKEFNPYGPGATQGRERNGSRTDSPPRKERRKGRR